MAPFAELMLLHVAPPVLAVLAQRFVLGTRAEQGSVKQRNMLHGKPEWGSTEPKEGPDDCMAAMDKGLPHQVEAVINASEL